LSSAGLYVTTKQRGKRSQKTTWGIEQNEAQQTYLSQYFAIDNVNHMVSIASINHICWEYWHSPYLHALSIAVVAAYDMYVECCEGSLDQSWRIEPKDRMSFRLFRLLLSEQMLQYSPTNLKFPGNKCFQAWTRRTKRQRDKSTNSHSSTSTSVSTMGVNIDNYKKAKYGDRRTAPRLCGDLQYIKKHFESLKKMGNKMKCEVCGELTTMRCGLCKKYMCLFKKKKFIGGQCAMTYHNDCFFGLAKSDSETLHGIPKNNWVPPSTNKRWCNERRIEMFKLAIWEQGE
jgi:hypothetical protein